jgi:TolB-like protein
MLDQVPSLTIVRKTIPLELEDAVFRALSKVKADRFATVGQFAEALLNPSSTHAWRTVTRTTTAQQQRRAWSPAKRRAVFAAWSTTFVFGTVGASYAGWRLFLHPARAVAATSAATGGLDVKRVAVMYFSDESDTKQLGFLADGLTEGLIEQLGRARTLDVISKNGVSAARALDVSQDAVRDSIAHALKVGTLVTGSVEEGGRGYRVTVRLVDAFSGADLEKKSFEAPKQNVLQIRDTLAAVVSEFLRKRIGDEVALRELRSGTSNTQAWALAQRAERTRKEAEAALAEDSTDVAVRRFAAADSLLATAESLDPAWAAPSVRRAEIALRQAKAAPPEAAVSLVATGLAHAERALARDTRNADALEARGTLYYVRYVRHLEHDPAKAKESLEQARTDLKAAVAISPSQANAYQVLSHLYVQEPDFTEAKLAAQRAYEEDAYLANAPDVIWRLYTSSYELEQFADAEHWCDEGSRRFPANYRFVECRLWLMTAPTNKADVKLAWGLVDSLKKVAPNAPGSIGGRRYQMVAAAVIARAGLSDSARNVATRSRANAELDPAGDLVSFEAFVHVLRKDNDEAFRLLKSALVANPDVHWVSQDESTGWWWRSLKSDPRWLELRRAVH